MESKWMLGMDYQMIPLDEKVEQNASTKRAHSSFSASFRCIRSRCGRKYQQVNCSQHKSWEVHVAVHIQHAYMAYKSNELVLPIGTSIELAWATFSNCEKVGPFSSESTTCSQRRKIRCLLPSIQEIRRARTKVGRNDLPREKGDHSDSDNFYLLGFETTQSRKSRQVIAGKMDEKRISTLHIRMTCHFLSVSSGSEK